MLFAQLEKTNHAMPNFITQLGLWVMKFGNGL